MSERSTRRSTRSAIRFVRFASAVLAVHARRHRLRMRRRGWQRELSRTGPSTTSCPTRPAPSTTPSAAHLRAEAQRSLGRSGRGREPRRWRHADRQRRRRQGAPGWLHPARRRVSVRRQSLDLQEPALRHGQGFHAADPGRPDPKSAGGAAFAAGQVGAGIHRLLPKRTPAKSAMARPGSVRRTICRWSCSRA